MIGVHSRRAFLGAMGAGMMAAAFGARAEEAAGGAGGDGIIGHGTHRYKVVPNWGVLDPKETPVKDCHGMVQDSKGRIILLTNHTKNNVIVYDKAGNLLEKWGTKWPGAHGLAIEKEGDEEFLYITDHDLHKVFKTTMSGEIVMTLNYPEETGFYEKEDLYKPTDVALTPNGDFFVCDGYGKAYVIKYDHPGKLLTTLGGPDKMSTPHGACVDRRDPDNPVLLVAVRGKQELHRYTLDAQLIDIIPMPGADVCTAYVFGDEVYVPNLNGFVSILDKNNKVISNPGGTAPEYDVEGKLRPMKQNDSTFIHPHDILVDDEGSVYVPQWNSNGTYPIKLERVKIEKV